jgi:arginine/serine-rich splicing factor 18
VPPGIRGGRSSDCRRPARRHSMRVATAGRRGGFPSSSSRSESPPDYERSQRLPAAVARLPPLRRAACGDPERTPAAVRLRGRRTRLPDAPGLNRAWRAALSGPVADPGDSRTNRANRRQEERRRSTRQEERGGSVQQEERRRSPSTDSRSNRVNRHREERRRSTRQEDRRGSVQQEERRRSTQRSFSRSGSHATTGSSSGDRRVSRPRNNGSTPRTRATRQTTRAPARAQSSQRREASRSAARSTAGNKRSKAASRSRTESRSKAKERAGRERP